MIKVWKVTNGYNGTESIYLHEPIFAEEGFDVVTEGVFLTDSELPQRDEQMRREGFQAAYGEAIVWDETTEEEFQVVWKEAFDDYLKSLEEEKDGD